MDPPAGDMTVEKEDMMRDNNVTEELQAKFMRDIRVLTTGGKKLIRELTYVEQLSKSLLDAPSNQSTWTEMNEKWRKVKAACDRRELEVGELTSALINADVSDRAMVMMNKAVQQLEEYVMFVTKGVTQALGKAVEEGGCVFVSAQVQAQARALAQAVPVVPLQPAPATPRLVSWKPDINLKPLNGINDETKPFEFKVWWKKFGVWIKPSADMMAPSNDTIQSYLGNFLDDKLSQIVSHLFLPTMGLDELGEVLKKIIDEKHPIERRQIEFLGSIKLTGETDVDCVLRMRELMTDAGFIGCNMTGEEVCLKKCMSILGKQVLHKLF